MALRALLALRETLTSELTINNYCTTHYGKEPKHLVGYKRAQNANDYPCLSYVPVRLRGDGSRAEAELVSVVIGVNDPAITDNVMMGHVRVAELADLIIDAILPGPLGDTALFAGRYDVIGDLGERHPFYELELQLHLLWRKK